MRKGEWKKNLKMGQFENGCGVSLGRALVAAFYNIEPTFAISFAFIHDFHVRSLRDREDGSDCHRFPWISFMAIYVRSLRDREGGFYCHPFPLISSMVIYV